jgi:hypothetical protein
MTTRIVALVSSLVLCAACGLAPFETTSVRAGSDPTVVVECPGLPAVPPGACSSWGDGVLAALVLVADVGSVRELAAIVRLERAGERRCRAIVLDARGVGRWIGRAACPV